MAIALAPSRSDAVILRARNPSRGIHPHDFRCSRAARSACAHCLNRCRSRAIDARGTEAGTRIYRALRRGHSLNPSLKPEIQWVVKWMIEIPDVHVDLCTILDKLPKGDKKDGQTLSPRWCRLRPHTFYSIPTSRTTRWRSIKPAFEGALRINEASRRRTPKTASRHLDDLIQRREAGTLSQFVKERAEAACKVNESAPECPRSCLFPDPLFSRFLIICSLFPDPIPFSVLYSPTVSN